jgi:hypothetical protein
MAKITSADVARLRKVTLAGMMDCKKHFRKQTATSKKQWTSSEKKALLSSQKGPTAKQLKAWLSLKLPPMAKSQLWRHSAAKPICRKKR